VGLLAVVASLAAVFGGCIVAAVPQAQEENRTLRIHSGFRLTFRYFHTMKPRRSNQGNQALTKIEVVVIIAVLAILVAVLLPAMPKAKHRQSQINCFNNLHQIGIAFKVWEHDNNDKYPMEVSVTDGGAMELAAAGDVVAIFQVISNELNTPLLVCPADTGRSYAKNFASGFTTKNISYFAGLDVTNETIPQLFLSGDCNFALEGTAVKSSLLRLPTNALVTWTAARHVHKGYIGFADGAVWRTDDKQLPQILIRTGVATNRLAIP
jgi:competence protein ComGC